LVKTWFAQLTPDCFSHQKYREIFESISNTELNDISANTAHDATEDEDQRALIAALSVEELVKTAIQSWGLGQYIIENEMSQPHEAGLLKLDISKVKSDLKWMPKINANQAVSMTMHWYKQFFQDHYKIKDYTINQILQFFNE
ncbi:MAG: CDP-glucose 4,6-dehydratase, partial [Pseudomonadota bacterium]